MHRVWLWCDGKQRSLTRHEDPVPPLPRLLGGHDPHGLHRVTVDVPEPLHVREAPRVAHHLHPGCVSGHPAPPVLLPGPTHPHWLLHPLHHRPAEEAGVSTALLLAPADHVLPVRLLVGAGVQEPLEVQAMLLQGEGVSRARPLSWGMAWQSSARRDVVQRSTAQHSSAWHGTAQHNMAQLSMGWHGTA